MCNCVANNCQETWFQFSSLQENNEKSDENNKPMQQQLLKTTS